MFLYLTTDGQTITKDGGRIIIHSNKEDKNANESQVPLSLVEGIVVFGRVQLSTDVIKECLKGKIPVFFVSKYGNYFGKLDSLEYKNVDLLYNHIFASMDEKISLGYAKTFIISKIHNSRIMLMRWANEYGGMDKITGQLAILKNIVTKIETIENKEKLRGMEGYASKIYFEAMRYFIKEPFVFNERNRRPPRDPVNSMLSMGYTLLAQTIHMIIDIYGINNQIGFFHEPKDIRSLLVLDVMEMFRSWIVDHIVVSITQKRKLTLDDFYYHDKEEKKSCLFVDESLKTFINEYYHTVFKTKEQEIGENPFIKLKMIEKNMEQFKKSLVSKTYDYEGFKIK